MNFNEHQSPIFFDFQAVTGPHFESFLHQICTTLDLWKCVFYYSKTLLFDDLGDVFFIVFCSCSKYVIFLIFLTYFDSIWLPYCLHLDSQISLFSMLVSNQLFLSMIVFSPNSRQASQDTAQGRGELRPSTPLRHENSSEHHLLMTLCSEVQKFPVIFNFTMCSWS